MVGNRGVKMYKGDAPITKEQHKEIMALHEEGKHDLAMTYLDKYLEENYTDEFKQKLSEGLVEGVGMDLDMD